MKITMILAMDRNRLIGYKGGLPWQHSEDLKWFKEKTISKAVLMGRLTWNGINRRLPSRDNFVLTSDTEFAVEGVLAVKSIDQAIAVATDLGRDELVIMGGKKLYESCLTQVDEIYVTVIDSVYRGDTHMEHPLFHKLLGKDFSENNPAWDNLGFDRVFCKDPETNETLVFDITVEKRVLSNDVMLNFLKLIRCK